MKKIETNVEINKIEEAIEKTKELVSLLERANQLIQSFGNTTINNFNS